MNDIDAWFSTMSVVDMRRLLEASNVRWDKNMTRQELQMLLLANNIIGPPPSSPTTDDDDDVWVLSHLAVLVAGRIDTLQREISRAALKQRLLGEIDALEWVMEQINRFRATTEITNEPCNTCHGRGWVVEGHEQVECPDCWEEVVCGEPPQQSLDMTLQQPGESRAEWKNRTFAMQYGQGPGDRLSQRDPFQQTIPPLGALPDLPLPPWVQEDATVFRDWLNQGIHHFPKPTKFTDITES